MLRTPSALVNWAAVCVDPSHPDRAEHSRSARRSSVMEKMFPRNYPQVSPVGAESLACSLNGNTLVSDGTQPAGAPVQCREGSIRAALAV